MTIYIKVQNGNSLLEKGRILTIGGRKSFDILTGEDREKLLAIGSYRSKEEAKEVFEMITERIVRPTDPEIKRGVVYIDLNELEKHLEN